MSDEALTAFETGKKLLDDKKAPEAVSAFAKAVRLAPQIGEYRAWYAQALLGDGQPEAALREAEHAVQLDPQGGKGYRLVGHAAGKLKDDTRAIQAYSQAIKLDENDTTAYDRRGDCYYRLNDYKRAIEDYSHVVALMADDLQGRADALAERGNAYHMLKDFEKAIADAHQAITLVPTHARAFATRGWAYAAQQKYRPAIDDYNRAIELGLKQLYVYARRLDSYYAVQDWPNWVLDYARTLELGDKPSFTDSKGFTSPVARASIETSHKHFRESLLPGLLERGEKLVYYAPLLMLMWGRRSGQRMVNGASFQQELGTEGHGYVCVSNHNVYLCSFGQISMAFDREAKGPLSFLQGFLPVPDQTEVCKTDQSWTVQHQSLQGTQIITDPLIKHPSVRMVTHSQTWDLYTFFDDVREILSAALNLALAGQLVDWWPKKPSPDQQAARSTIDLLKELGDLMKSGVITEAEFEAKKRELLARL